MLALKIAYELGFEINIALMEIQMQNGMVPAGMLTTTKKNGRTINELPHPNTSLPTSLSSLSSLKIMLFKFWSQKKILIVICDDWIADERNIFLATYYFGCVMCI